MSTIKTHFRAFCVFASVVAAIVAGTSPSAAFIVPPVGLAASSSNSDLVLSFLTTTTNYYGLQMSPDLSSSWTNIRAGIRGDGLVETVTLSNALSAGQAFYRMAVQPAPSQLLLPQSMAFSIIGYDCGGIQEKIYLTGFDPTNGFPTANVELKTICSCGKDCSSTHTASAAVSWDLAGNVIFANAPATGSPANPSFIATDGSNDIIFNSGGNAYLIVPVPAAPTGVAAIQSNDQFQVSWTPNGVNPAAVISSTLTATPVNNANASNLTTVVSGPIADGIITMLQPATTYQITVVSATLGGSGPASAPISVTTSAATILPSAPPGVMAQWAAPNADPGPNNIIATWQAADPGNSPVDQYVVTISNTDIGGSQTNSVPGTTLTTSFNSNVDSTYNWSVTVQGHNAAGWGPVSAAYSLGGL